MYDRPLPSSADVKAETRARADFKLTRKTKLHGFEWTISERLQGAEREQALRMLPETERHRVGDVFKRLSTHSTHAAAKAELARLEGIAAGAL